ncbi:copper resistance protein NlpE N-terminal domain-containing protein [Psychromonas sp. MME2]|uniref:copper resistance protein NlpE n=1 Tax=unclassified Psychromonas TaxID=2614957 RepID=UPI00339CF8DA
MKSIYRLVFIASLSLVGCQQKESDTQAIASHNAAAEIPDTHSARTSLDWNGIYKGNVPCDDCEGIELFVELKQDGTYMLSKSYLGKMSAAVMQEGPIVWDGNIIAVDDLLFLVGENQLFLVDQQGTRIVDQAGSAYSLHKEIE